MKQEMFWVTNYTEIERLIKETYRIRYDILEGDEIGSSQWSASYNPTLKKKKLDQWEAKELKEWKEGKTHFHMIRTLMQDMCNNGVLQPGHYAMDVSW